MLRELLPLLKAARARAFWRSSTLEPLIEDLGSADAAGVFFRPSVTLNGESRPSVSIPWSGAAVCRVQAPADAVMSVYCGLEGTDAAEARFTVSFGDQHRECTVRTGEGWVPLTVPLRRERGPSVLTFRNELTVASPRRSSSGAEAGETVRAVWGSPSLQWRRTFGEAVRFVVRAVRHYGLEGSIARARAHGSVNTSEPHKVYRQWLAAHAPNQTALDRMHAASRALPVQPRFALFVRAPHSSSDLVARTVASLERQAYPEWDLWLWRGGSGPVDVGFDHVVTGSDSEADARTTVASTSTADFIATMEAGDELAPEALFEIASAIAREPRADLVYSDEDRLLADGPGDPTFKPGWSPEYLLARFYLGGLLAIRRQAILDASGYRAACDGAHDYDVALRTTARGARVLHVPKMLYHRMAFRATNADAERVALEDVCRTTARDALVLPGAFPGTWRVKHRVPDAAVVTIVIPTAARVGPTVAGLQPLVLQTIESIVQRTSYTRYELLIADNGALPVAVTRALSGVPHRVVTFRPEGRFNFSGIVNFGVSHVTTDYVLLLNDDIEVINADWLTAMLEYATQEAIGAVGPKLFYPDGRLQHVGVATGVGGIAAHLLHQQPGGSTGCGEMAFTVRNCSAVTAACLLTRREIFERVGGFDERFAIDFNDVDFCLKVRAAGYRIVFTPYAKLYHHESASFGSRLQHAQEIEAMREIWGSALEADPYYNPNLSRDFSDCRVADPA